MNWFSSFRPTPSPATHPSAPTPARSVSPQPTSPVPQAATAAETEAPVVDSPNFLRNLFGSSQYEPDSANIFGGDSSRVVVAGSQITDIGDQEGGRRGIQDRQANRILQQTMGDQADSLIQHMDTLRDRLGNPSERNEFNRYAAILSRNMQGNPEGFSAILTQSEAMLNNPAYPEALPNNEVMLSALHDIAMPQNISQREIGSCMAGAAQIQMAMADPQQYLHMVDSLAAGESVNLGGVELPSNLTFLQETGANNYRTPSTALVQNAILDAMLYADSNNRMQERAYDSSAVIPMAGLSEDTIRGYMNNGFVQNNGNLIMAFQASNQNLDRISRVLSGFTGQNYAPTRTEQVVPNPENPTQGTLQVDPAANRAMINRLQNMSPPPSAQNPILSYMNWSQGTTAEGQVSHGIHALSIVGIENNQVTVYNPWGRQETFSLQELEQRLRGVVLPQ